MKASLLVGGLVALLTGLAIGTQATISSRVGAMIGDMQTGLLTSLFGGTVGLILVSGWYLWRPGDVQLTLPAGKMLLIAGILGLFIIAGISFSLQRVGVAAGLAALILGQMAISISVDALGIGGVEPIPVTFQRVLGLVTMAFAVYLLLPRP